MQHTPGHRAIARAIAVHRDAVVQGDEVPESVANYALTATLSAMASRPAAGWSAHAARAYFDTVARKRLIKTHSRSRAAVRVIADTIVADLIESGRSPSEAWDELARGWAHMVPELVLEEYRDKLSA